MELEIHKESGYILSDAARRAYIEAMYGGASVYEALASGLRASKEVHTANMEHFGSIENYMTSHTLKGTEIGGVAPRSMISFTTEQNVTSRFGENAFSASVPKSGLLYQTHVPGSEAEVFVLHMIKI